VNKEALSESDICDRYITPAIERAGWTSDKWRREFSFTDGKVIVRGKMVARGKPRRADYLLFHTPNRPIAVIEAKDNKHSVRAGMQQGLDYAERLDVPFVFASNGDGFVLRDKTGTYPATEMTRYIRVVLEAPHIRSQIEAKLRTTSGVKNVNSQEIMSWEIPLPPLGEQVRIADTVERLLQGIHAVRSALFRKSRCAEDLAAALAAV